MGASPFADPRIIRSRINIRRSCLYTCIHLPFEPDSVKYDPETGEAVEGSPYDADSASVIRLSNGMILYLREVDE